jgi:eukaryotic-like serine/threonine-protein kinase
MPIDSVAGLIEELRQNKLLRAPQLDEIERMLQPRFSSPLGLAKELVRRGWLTVYQVNQLFQANGQQLTLGPYRILDYVGKGGASQVFKAWHTGRDCLVALKVILPEFLSNPEAVGRFHREMQVVTRLAHPNIVRSFEEDAYGQALFFAMEFVQGTDLDKVTNLAGALPIPQACDYIRQAALGLQHAHEQGLVHRDIKPANLVQIVNTHTIKILDFGLARLRDTTPNATGAALVNLTAQGTLLGTPDYVSPEQAKDARSVDIRADIYSLGCTFYFLLAGGPPFPGGSALQKIHNHMKKEPTAITILRPEVPPAVVGIVKKMMAKVPDDRYSTPGDVAAAVAPFSEEHKD